ncbi:MAG: SGNH hydrolase domain-containing protein [Candidatus Limnocylindrales bacterium]
MTRAPAAIRAFGLALLALTVSAPTVLAADRDGDGLRDGFEARYGVTSPDRKDSDYDGVVDGAEDSDGDKLGNLAEQRFGLNPAKKDTDGDGRKDGIEDHDADGRTNKLEQYQRPVPNGLTPSLANAPRDFGGAAGGCDARQGSSALERCFFGPTGTGTRVALMGDSHAMVMADPFRRVAVSDGFRLITYFKGGCPPVLGVMSYGQRNLDGGKSCRQWRLQAIKAINANPPDLLVITASESYKILDANGGILPKPKRPARWGAGMGRLIDRISPRTEILVLGDVPQNWKHPVRCLKLHPRNMARCTSRWQPLAKRTVEKALREAVDARGERFATLYYKVCPTDPCPLVQGKTMMWRDKSHLTGSFARKLTPSVRKILRPILD